MLRCFVGEMFVAGDGTLGDISFFLYDFKNAIACLDIDCAKL
jgi:hypothetical protein